MTIYIFLGPTLTVTEATTELDAIYLSPVAQGDVYRVARMRPDAIGIIDGYFDHVPAVWHKEILWALHQGIPVFGSSSMGALRAAELETYGMEGIGQIFADYRDGLLEDDDEVAIAHGPAEMGYKPLSEALVNIRSTLRGAVRDQIISPETEAGLIAIAKELFYPDRLYPTLLFRASEAHLSDAELKALRHWLPANRVDQKHEDALLLLRELRTRCRDGLHPPACEFIFQHTQGWEQLVQTMAERLTPDVAGTEAESTSTAIIEELQMTGDNYHCAKREAIRRTLALNEARRRGIEVGEDALHDAILKFRRNYKLFDPQDVKGWLQTNGLTPEQFARIIEQDEQIAWVDDLFHHNIDLILLDQLRLHGEYDRLQIRARDKQRLLSRLSDLAVSLPGAESDEQKLVAWFSASRLNGKPLTDVAAYAVQVGFKDRAAFLHALRREYHYSQIASTDGQ